MATIKSDMTPDALRRVLYNIDLSKRFTDAWHTNITRWRRLYNFDHYDSPAKSGEFQYRDPTYTNTVDLAVGILLGNEMIWRATGFSVSPSEMKNSDKVEKFLAGTIEVNSDRTECDIPYEVDMHFVRDGGGVLYTIWNPNAKLTQGVYTEIPIITKVIDPLRIFVLPGGPKRWKVIARIDMRTVADVEMQYGKAVPEELRAMTEEEKNSSKYEYIDYWEMSQTPDGGVALKNAVLFSGRFLIGIRDMPGYRDYPYALSLYKPTSRDDSGQWQSILSPMESTVQEMEKAINRRQRQIDMNASLPLVSTTKDGRVLRADEAFGEIIQLQEGESLSFPVWMGNPPDVREQIDFFRARVQQAGFSDVMYGSGPSAISGYALSQMGDQNRIRLEQPVLHIEKLWTWWATRVLDMMDTFAQGPVRVYGRVKGQDFVEEIKKEDILGFQVKCEIIPDFPNEQVRKHAMATQVRGILSDQTIIQDYLGIQNPEDERQRKLIETTVMTPELLK